MLNAFTIAGRELRALFCSPLAWVMLAALQAILGWMFLLQVKGYEELAPSLAGVPGAPGITVIVVSPVLKTSAMILLMMAPLGLSGFKPGQEHFVQCTNKKCRKR